MSDYVILMLLMVILKQVFKTPTAPSVDDNDIDNDRQ